MAFLPEMHELSGTDVELMLENGAPGPSACWCRNLFDLLHTTYTCDSISLA